MKGVLLVLSAILVGIQCRPQPQILDFFTKTVPEVISNNVQNFVRGFSFNVDTTDEFHHEARGELRSETGRKEDEGLEVVGSYSYIGDDGLLYRVDYTAGKDGFKPRGAHLVPSADVQVLGVGESTCASIHGCGLG